MKQNKQKIGMVIFDLDQTIVDPFPQHNKATQLCMKKIFGVKARLDEIDFSGRTLRDNLEELALKKGIKKEEIKKKIDRAIGEYSNLFLTLVKKIRPLPGVKKLIKKLSEKFVICLVTGDSKKIASSILQKISLISYFKFMITGEKTKDRNEMVREAIRKAKRYLPRKFVVIVIGDSMHDIESAKANRAKAIGVLTGFTSARKLKQAGAGLVVKNLADKKVLKFVEKEVEKCIQKK